jgi:hypothetical protein
MKLLRVVITILLCTSFTACHDSPKQGQPAQADSTGSLQATETALNAGAVPGQTARVLTESEADSLLQLQQQIMQQPDAVTLRRELGRRAIDTTAGVIWVVGKGRINPKATTLNTALNQAKMAATLDAGRWAAYLREWQKTDYAADFGKIQASVPGIKVVRESMTDSLCIVLAQVSLQ